MKRPFVLVKRPTSTATAEAAQTVAQDAKQGRVIGMASVVMYIEPEPHFVTIVTDEADNNPVFTMGMLASLTHQLMAKANE